MRINGQIAGRLLSVVVALVYLTIVYWRTGSGGATVVGVVLLLPLALIWFGDDIEIPYLALGDCTRSGYDWTPGFLIRGIGWLFLLVPAIIWLIRR